MFFKNLTGRSFFTFRVRCSWDEMCSGHCVCVSVCLSVALLPHTYTTARTRM